MITVSNHLLISACISFHHHVNFHMVHIYIHFIVAAIFYLLHSWLFYLNSAATARQRRSSAPCTHWYAEWRFKPTISPQHTGRYMCLPFMSMTFKYIYAQKKNEERSKERMKEIRDIERWNQVTSKTLNEFIILIVNVCSLCVFVDR